MLKKVLLFLGGAAAGACTVLGIGALVNGAKKKDKKSYIEVPTNKKPEAEEAKAPEPEKKEQ